MALLNPPPPLQNPLLQQAEAAIEKTLGQGQARSDYLKIVVAGMRAALDKGPDSLVAKLNASRDPISDAAVGAANLVFYMRHLSRGTMPGRGIVPAATTLMFHALDFIDNAGIAKVGPAELDRATHILTNTLAKNLGMTPDMLNQAATAVHGIMQDPQHMAAIQRQMPAVPKEG